MPFGNLYQPRKTQKGGFQLEEVNAYITSGCGILGDDSWSAGLSETQLSRGQNSPLYGGNYLEILASDTPNRIPPSDVQPFIQGVLDRSIEPKDTGGKG